MCATRAGPVRPVQSSVQSIELPSSLNVPTKVPSPSARIGGTSPKPLSRVRNTFDWSSFSARTARPTTLATASTSSVANVSLNPRFLIVLPPDIQIPRSEFTIARARSSSFQQCPARLLRRTQPSPRKLNSLRGTFFNCRCVSEISADSLDRGTAGANGRQHTPVESFFQVKELLTFCRGRSQCSLISGLLG